ncbi:MAG: hypothetical protein HQ514_11045 [Rhodospirillales bacterium]|nr:hypothetical protein [Rhodospirillales bacterium]
MTLGAMSLILEGTVSVLLIAVIVYAIKLNRRILALRSQEGELKDMISQFNDAAIQAEASVGHLKTAGMESERNLRATIERAQAMRDDLSFVIERGGNMSNRVERTIERSRDRRPAKPVSMPIEPVMEEREERDDREVERNAERAVEGLVDRFANQAESSFWRGAKRDLSDNPTEIMPSAGKTSGIDREHWFDDDPISSKAPANPLAEPTAFIGSRVSAWTPGAGSTAVESTAVESTAEEIPAQDTAESSRSDAERELLRALRTSGVRS